MELASATPDALSRAGVLRTCRAGVTQPAVVRLVGAGLLEQSNEWATQRARFMTLETIGAVSDTPHVSLSAVTA